MNVATVNIPKSKYYSMLHADEKKEREGEVDKGDLEKKGRKSEKTLQRGRALKR